MSEEDMHEQAGKAEGKLHVRPAVSSDIQVLTELDHGFSTDHVWQMGYQGGVEGASIQFQEVRLPRPMRVRYPRDPHELLDEWTHKLALLISETGDAPCGYLAVEQGPAPGSAWVTDLLVDLRHRRQGHGTSLLRAVRGWTRERGYRSLFLEMQSKNYPAICLARKLGYEFSGYSDRYFPDQDIALFFSLNLE
jgi:ribosomal protein S18 acetylase RimI-like enzyme